MQILDENPLYIYTCSNDFRRKPQTLCKHFNLNVVKNKNVNCSVLLNIPLLYGQEIN